MLGLCVQPFIPTSHPQAAVYAFAERAARLILTESRVTGGVD